MTTKAKSKKTKITKIRIYGPMTCSNDYVSGGVALVDLTRHGIRGMLDLMDTFTRLKAAEITDLSEIRTFDGLDNHYKGSPALDAAGEWSELVPDSHDPYPDPPKDAESLPIDCIELVITEDTAHWEALTDGESERWYTPRIYREKLTTYLERLDG